LPSILFFPFFIGNGKRKKKTGRTRKRDEKGHPISFFPSRFGKEQKGTGKSSRRERKRKRKASSRRVPLKFPSRSRKKKKRKEVG